jgi:hypothetical protein
MAKNVSLGASFKYAYIQYIYAAALNPKSKYAAVLERLVRSISKALRLGL